MLLLIIRVAASQQTVTLASGILETATVMSSVINMATAAMTF